MQREYKEVLVLLATHNGEKYLDAQINSILNQKEVNVYIYACDDNSSDSTIDILKKYEKKGKLSWISGNFGSAQKNFYNLINTSKDYKYYALSDQDDYWLEDKLITAIKKLDECSSDIPSLYYGVSTPVDSNLDILDKQYKHSCVDNIYSSLIVSNAQGATFVFNKRLRDIIKNKNTKTKIMHDSWIHKTCIAVGGKIFFDLQSHMLYRIHENNVFARNNKGFFNKIKQKIQYLSSKEKYYVLSNIVKEWYENFEDYLTEEAKDAIYLISKSKKIKTRIKILFGKKFRSPYKIDFLMFVILLLKGKL